MDGEGEEDLDEEEGGEGEKENISHSFLTQKFNTFNSIVNDASSAFFLSKLTS